MRPSNELALLDRRMTLGVGAVLGFLVVLLVDVMPGGVSVTVASLFRRLLAELAVVGVVASAVVVAVPAVVVAVPAVVVAVPAVVVPVVSVVSSP